MNEMENAAHLVGMGQPRVNGRNRTEPAWVQSAAYNSPTNYEWALFSDMRNDSFTSCLLAGRWGGSLLIIITICPGS